MRTNFAETGGPGPISRTRPGGRRTLAYIETSFTYPSAHRARGILAVRPANLLRTLVFFTTSALWDRSGVECGVKNGHGNKFLLCSIPQGEERSVRSFGGPSRRLVSTWPSSVRKGIVGVWFMLGENDEGLPYGPLLPGFTLSLHGLVDPRNALRAAITVPRRRRFFW